MKVFLSWSGERSFEIAHILAAWISKVVQSAEPWVSVHSTDTGSRWSEQASKRLDEVGVGIVCLVPENLASPWILFEVGALAKASVADIRILLLDLEPRDVRQPLALFQHTKFDREGMRQLVGTINEAVERGGGTALPDEDLDEVFEASWPSVESKVTQIMERTAEEYPPPRTNDREVLEEILAAVRRLEGPGETGSQR